MPKFSADLKSQGLSVGRKHLHDFLAHLEDAFLLQTISVATDSEKGRQVQPRKAYPADSALIPVLDRSGESDTGHALETAVFLEPQRRQAELAHVKTAGGFEVDFLARHLDDSKDLIQVRASVDDPAALAREVRALQAAAPEHPRTRPRLLTLEARLPFPAVPAPSKLFPPGSGYCSRRRVDELTISNWVRPGS